MGTETIIPYCERIATGAEPFNVLSNLAFALPFIYGIYRLNTIRGEMPLGHSQTVARTMAGAGSSRIAQATISWIQGLLVLLTAVIGCGSALFHYSPSVLTHLADVIPIIGFALLTTLLVLLPSQHSSFLKVSVITIWIACSAIATAWPEVLAHSLFYLPTVGLLATLAYLLEAQRGKLIVLTIVFGCALLARAMDLQTCELLFKSTSLSIGTHVLWHVLAALAAMLALAIALVPFKHHADRSTTQRH